MGGLFFASGPEALETPRMPPVVYHHARAGCLAALRNLFVYVASPIEGPAKKDYGDIDIVAATDGAALRGSDLMPAIETALGAVRMTIEHDNSAHLALPWPVEHGMADHMPSKPCFIQVDVHICDSFESMSWRLFINAHGDFCIILGAMLRSFGLTIDDKALWLRIPEIETFDRKRARVFLTSNSADVLAFLGMDVDDLGDRPFPNEEALFRYVATCRLFAAWDPPDTGRHHQEQEEPVMKAKHRRQINQRPVFYRWITDFVPRAKAETQLTCSGDQNTQQDRQQPLDQTAAVRDTVCREAEDWFSVKYEYEMRKTEWLVERQEHEIRRVVINEILDEATSSQKLDPPYRSCVAKALMHLIMNGDSLASSYGLDSTPVFKTVHGLYDMDVVKIFIARNWERVGKLAWQRQLEKKTNAKKTTQHP